MRPVVLMLIVGFWGPAGVTNSTGRVSSHSAATAPARVAAGNRLFQDHCAVCHGIEGKGGRGPGLNRAKLTHASDDAALKSVIANGIRPQMPGNTALSSEELLELVVYVRSLGEVPSEPLPGNASRGARIYAKAGCHQCHIVAGEGTGYGPELTDIGKRHAASFIRASVARPAAALPDGFALVDALTLSGAKIAGICVNEDTFSIQIKDAAGEFHSLRKENLRALQKRPGETPMPAYEGILNPSDLTDLVAYLASLRGNP